MPQLSLHTPLGPLTVSQEDDAIVSLDWGAGRDQTPTALLSRAVEQLHAYFDGEYLHFDLPLATSGTAYHRHVFDALCAIPVGQVRTYGELAALAGGSARAIGGAMRANPIPIIIPCHRVVAAAGLGGYSGGEGAETKLFLLRHEGALVAGDRTPLSASSAARTQTDLFQSSRRNREP